MTSLLDLASQNLVVAAYDTFLISPETWRWAEICVPADVLGYSRRDMRMTVCLAASSVHPIAGLLCWIH